MKWTDGMIKPMTLKTTLTRAAVKRTDWLDRSVHYPVAQPVALYSSH